MPTWKLFPDQEAETGAFLFELRDFFHTLQMLFVSHINRFPLILPLLASNLKLFAEDVYLILQL